MSHRYSRPELLPVINRRLRLVLAVVFTLFALLSVNALYLASITFLEWVSDNIYQDYFYQINMLVHLGVGLILVVPFFWFGIAHMKRAIHRVNYRAIKIGIALFSTGTLLIASGFVLTRFDFLEIRDPLIRLVAYWLHVLTPLAAAWLFVLHRKAGRPIRWSIGFRWLGVAISFAGIMLVVHVLQRPPETKLVDEQPFAPAFTRTVNGEAIPPERLMMDGYCQECHADVHAGWEKSVHKFSSFNNPAYLAAVKEAKTFFEERDGHSRELRFCAACHDPVPMLSGKLEEAGFDMDNDPTGKAGITCSACHAIEEIGSTRGNGDYLIANPQHYPFTDSEHPFLKWLNRMLVKAKPEFHKKTFLKPLHETAEFCSVCHKVSIPESVNRYQWLRGQNHYDAYLLSGVSGHGASSFYYPPQAVDKCAQCHMPLQTSDDFGAQHFDGSTSLSVHDHQFPAANTAVAKLVGMPDAAIAARQAFLKDSLRVDIFGIREEGEIDGKLTAPLRPESIWLEPGKTYLVEVVLRTLKLGHTFTQGTADSNQVWLEADASIEENRIGSSGTMNVQTGQVDPWSHFVNAYVLDRDGRRIDRRNAQDVFTTLYNNQIPPGAADVVHYRLRVPENASGAINLRFDLNYRKFDTVYLRYFLDDPTANNTLPVTLIASDNIRLSVAGTPIGETPAVDIPQWQRWNDYGIGLLRKQRGLQLRQAEAAFKQVESLGRPEGAINLARVYLKEGRLDEAADALRRAAGHELPVTPWVITWLTGRINRQNGQLESAIDNFRSIVENRFPEATARGFDFSLDYRVQNQLGQALFERAKQLRGKHNQEARQTMLREAVEAFQQTLTIDSENLEAHYNLAQLYSLLEDQPLRDKHRALHRKYKIDDNASDKVIAMHRSQNPAADHAAEAVVIYDLQRTD